MARPRVPAHARLAEVRAWEALPGPDGRVSAFAAVFCVGNSLTHAPGHAGRLRALSAMAACLRPDGRLVLTSRDWEAIRAARPGLEVSERMVERHGRRALVVHAWTFAEDWDAPHALDVAVAFPEPDGTVARHAERLTFWPFAHATLLGELAAAGLELESTTYGGGAERYVVVARPGPRPRPEPPAARRSSG